MSFVHGRFKEDLTNTDLGFYCRKTRKCIRGEGNADDYVFEYTWST